jgi:sugar O-acyltransferase (sialic acid O-acetyltransferase NeuD family)
MLLEIRPPFATLIHPSAVVMGAVGPGCIVAPGAVIDPIASLDTHVFVNKNASVGHDASIGSLSVLGPVSMIGGWCQLHEAVYIGAGALIRERLEIGRNAIIGMGSVVTRDVPANKVAMGNPARITEKSNSGGGWLS